MKNIEKIIRTATWERWDSWSQEQKDFILKYSGKSVGETDSSPKVHSNNYYHKNWEFAEARPDHGEICEHCKFPYCFYAEPRNWSMSSDADVWNLMKCANVQCGRYFESCF